MARAAGKFGMLEGERERRRLATLREEKRREEEVRVLSACLGYRKGKAFFPSSVGGTKKRQQVCISGP